MVVFGIGGLINGSLVSVSAPSLSRFARKVFGGLAIIISDHPIPIKQRWIVNWERRRCWVSRLFFDIHFDCSGLFISETELEHFCHWRQ